MKILISGATGLIGRALCHVLNEDGHTIVGVSRSSRKPSGLNVGEMYQWDSQAGPPPEAALNQVDAVINLAGEPIAAKRWSDQQKKSIRDSRIVTTRNLVEGMRRAKRKPEVFVSSSAVGYYGNRGDERLEETSPPGRGFMSEVCQEWEREAARASELGIRVVFVRTGVVLSADGGALEKMLPPFKMGAGGRLGSGKQWFPWIHIDDIVGIFRHSIVNAKATGPINGAAPQPATNAEFTRELGHALHRPAFLPVPEIALRILMGEMAGVLFDSQRVIPAAALASGYEFRYPQLGPALADVLSRK
ncbi:MAG TPA: TIGR01777 family oxidoreductase [Blastocatellia bacterium]|nr:TIGR01777 family oxidoreductase [Blastocatellia bacterium]